MTRKRKIPKRLRPVYAAVAVLAALLTALAGYFGQTDRGPTRTAQDYSVHFIDVGQGDSALLRLGEDSVLIDAGPTDAGDEVVRYLKEQGVTRLSAVIATHPHEDHIGGMGAVLAAFPTDAFYMPDRAASTKCFSRMLDGVEAQKLTPIVPEPGDTLTVGGVSITFLSPDPADRFENTNNFSLVARIDTGAERLLFAGDAETEIENALVAGGADLRADVYKVSHHGSRTSSSTDFLRAVRPRIAVISCGKDNEYGHPHPETLEALRAAQTQTIYTTAEQGSVVLPLELPAPT